MEKFFLVKKSLFYQGGGFFVQEKGLWFVKGIVSNTKPTRDSSIINPTCSDGKYALFTDVVKYLGKNSSNSKIRSVYFKDSETILCFKSKITQQTICSTLVVYFQ